MKLFRLLIFFGLLCILIGCSAVVTRYPVAFPSNNSKLQDLEGIWMTEDGPIFVNFDAQGRGQIASLEWKDQEYQILRGELLVSEVGTRHFLSIRIAEENQWDGEYFLAEFTTNPKGYLVVWEARKKLFEQAVRDKKLPGFIQEDRYGSDVILTARPEVLNAFIASWEGAPLFDRTKPVVLKKVN